MSTYKPKIIEGKIKNTGWPIDGHTLENVEVLRTVQEEVKENPVIKIGARKSTDRGGYICMPLADNVPEGRPDWKLTTCPECGRECWYRPVAEIAKVQGAAALCTMCALSKMISSC